MEKNTRNTIGLDSQIQSVEPTPRPWQAATTAKRGTWTIYQQGTPRTIATLPNDVKRDFDTGEANARLIVKAVNSFEPLRNALRDAANYRHVQQHILGSGDANFERCTAASCAQIRELLAGTEGAQ